MSAVRTCLAFFFGSPLTEQIYSVLRLRRKVGQLQR